MRPSYQLARPETPLNLDVQVISNGGRLRYVVKFVKLSNKSRKTHEDLETWMILLSMSPIYKFTQELTTVGSFNLRNFIFLSDMIISS